MAGDRGRGEVRSSRMRSRVVRAEREEKAPPKGRDLKGVPPGRVSEVVRRAREDFENVDLPAARRKDVTPMARGYKAMRKAMRQAR